MADKRSSWLYYCSFAWKHLGNSSTFTNILCCKVLSQLPNDLWFVINQNNIYEFWQPCQKVFRNASQETVFGQYFHAVLVVIDLYFIPILCHQWNFMWLLLFLSRTKCLRYSPRGGASKIIYCSPKMLSTRGKHVCNRFIITLKALLFPWKSTLTLR